MEATFSAFTFYPPLPLIIVQIMILARKCKFGPQYGPCLLSSIARHGSRRWQEDPSTWAWGMRPESRSPSISVTDERYEDNLSCDEWLWGGPGGVSSHLLTTHKMFNITTRNDFILLTIHLSRPSPRGNRSLSLNLLRIGPWAIPSTAWPKYIILKKPLYTSKLSS
jgi:hypothetical protein